MDSRRGKKSRLYLSAKRKRCNFKGKGKQRKKKTVEASLVGNENISADYSEGDEWISCQADANKLNKQKCQTKGSLFSPDECWPEEQIKPTVATNTKKSVATFTPVTKEEEKKELYIDTKTQINDVIDYEIFPEDIQSSSEKKPDVDGQLSREEKPDTYGIEVAVADDKGNLPALLQEWEIKKQLCRCCLVEGTFDSLHSPAPGDDLTYDDMLMQTFTIQLFPVSSDVTTALRGVCGLCAARLRDAHAFRHQVIATEARFRDLYTRNCITVAGAAVLEIELKQDTTDIENCFGMDDADTSPDLLVEHKKTAENRPRITKNKKKNEPRPKRKGNKKTTQTEQKVATATTEPRNNTKPKKNDVIRRQTGFIWKDGAYYKCRKCEMASTKLSNLQKHLRKVHPETSTLKCTLCDNRLKTKTRLILHRLKEHNIDDRHKCGACDKIFNLKIQLNRHLESFHMMGERVKCSMCDYECFSQKSMQKHMVTHQTSKNFHCKYCKKSFKRLTTLQFHERIHTGDKRKACAKCGQTFVQKASLNYHMAKHHPDVKF